jgi:hypothetical protein
MLFPCALCGTTVAKAMADPKRRSGRTKAIKTFMVTSAYRPIEFSGMSQAGALKGTFVLNICSAGQTNSYHHATPNITEVTPSYFEGTWRDCPAQGPTPGPSGSPGRNGPSWLYHPYAGRRPRNLGPDFASTGCICILFS